MALRSRPEDVRAGLGQIGRWMTALGVACSERGAIQIALAEALNNVVEHAYGMRGDGWIEVRAWCAGEGSLAFRIRDRGAPMPGSALPLARSSADWSGVSVERLPEGGFGWGLIRALAARARYRRVGARNELTLYFNRK